jgi:hypothetical protein
MSYETIPIKIYGSGLLLIAFIILLIFLLTHFSNSTVTIPEGSVLNWNPDETIHLTYDKCKDLNRSLYINRLLKKDFRLPMCPERYVVLYDQSQEIVFIFNEELYENPTILTIDVTCDNSSGKC